MRRKRDTIGHGSRLLQLNLFSTPLGEFAKEATILCLEHEPARVKDFVLLQGVLRDVKEHCLLHPSDEGVNEGASDLEALVDTVDMINVVIDHYDEWKQKGRHLDRSTLPVTRSELQILFELRSILRARIVGLCEAKSR